MLHCQVWQGSITRYTWQAAVLFSTYICCFTVVVVKIPREKKYQVKPPVGTQDSETVVVRWIENSDEERKRTNYYHTYAL